MVVTYSRLRTSTAMKQSKLISQLDEYCGRTLLFMPSESYYWSPSNQTVFYQKDDSSEIGSWTMLHEACHGLLDHQTYESDFELVKLEVEAWERAEKLAADFGINLDQEHVQDCLDSYRDWQYKRSLCPRCDLGGVQIDQKTYSCLFCSDKWHVSESRFCRPYRSKSK